MNFSQSLCLSHVERKMTQELWQHFLRSNPPNPFFFFLTVGSAYFHLSLDTFESYSFVQRKTFWLSYLKISLNNLII